MTASTMRCWKRPLKLLAICWLCLWAALGAASEVEVRNPQLTPGDDGYTLSADFAFEFNSRLEEAVTRGVVLNFLVEFELTRVRWYWLDDKVASRSQTLRLSYNALTRQYRLSSGALHQNFSSLEEALRILSRLRHWQVIEKGEIAADVDYVASTRLRLDPSQMAKTFQVSALSNRDWSQSSEWLVWNFSPSEAAAAPGTGDAK